VSSGLQNQRRIIDGADAIPALTVLLCVERIDRLPIRLDIGAGR